MSVDVNSCAFAFLCYDMATKMGMWEQTLDTYPLMVGKDRVYFLVSCGTNGTENLGCETH